MKSFLFLFLCLFSPFSMAAEIHVAVASNFLATLNSLKPQFEALTGHQLLISSGSTGKLHEQILNGAPYDVLLAADTESPASLIASRYVNDPVCFNYAQGQLVLWSKNKMTATNIKDALYHPSVKHIAIANPLTAPYGMAAKRYLLQIETWPDLQSRIVRGESVGQAFQFAATGNAQLGFVALSQVLKWNADQVAGQYWPVPVSQKSLLAQCGVVLKQVKDKDAADLFVSFLLSEKIQRLIQEKGYRAD